MSKSQIEGIVDSLIQSANDKEEDAQDAIFKSLVDIGRKRFSLVLSITHGFLVKHPKLSRSHRIVLLKLMETMIKEQINELEDDLASQIISLASAELTQSQDVIPDWQTAASNLLSTLGKKYPKDVLQELLKKFQAGQLPHFFVVSTLGQLATANVGEIVPLLKTVMARMLPMLGLAKLENMQWVFSNAIARFCEAIIDFLADEQRATSSGITPAQFEGEVFSAFDTLFNVWLLAKDARLRLAVVESIGYCVHLLAADSLNDQLPKLVPGVIQLYRKHSEHYYITQCLCMIMDAAGKKECANLPIQLDNLLNLLHQQACSPMDQSNSLALKNRHEVLRCFAVACKGYSQKVISFLLTKLDVSQEKIKAPTLEIFRHLINSCDQELDDKKPLVVSGMKIILTEQSLKVRSLFGQVIIAMAHHHYLELEGGHSLIEFIVKQCAIDPDDKSLVKLTTETDTPKRLKNMSENVLQLITTTMPHMDSVLWPSLLEFISPVQYFGAIGIVCRCVAAIAGKKKEANDEDYDIDFEELVNIPKPTRMIAFLFALLGHPHKGNGRGEHILACLKVIIPIIQDELIELWDAVIPKLLSYLNGMKEYKEEYQSLQNNLETVLNACTSSCNSSIINSEHEDDETWDQKQWEDRVLKFISLSLDQLSNEEWLLELGGAMSDKEYISVTFNNYPEEKGFLYKCLGVVMRKTTHKQFVQTSLEVMFGTVKHTSQEEREGCAIGTGFAATNHLDLVAEKLEAITKQDMVKKSKGFFGFSKDKTDADIERIKATVLLCYGYVSFHSPAQLITSRVEVSILRVINPHFAKVKDTVVKQNLIRTINLIGRSVHPAHLKNDEFIFNGRKDLVNHLLSYIQAEPATAPITNNTRSLSMDALATLVKLKPRLTEADQFEIIKVTTDSIIPAPALSPNIKRKEITVTPEENVKLTNDAQSDLQSLLIVILSREYSSDNLESIFKHLDPWVRSNEPIERTRGLDCVLKLLENYYEHAIEDEECRVLPLQSHLIGRMVPRCCDPLVYIRQNALVCIQVVLKIACCANPAESDKLINALSILRERAESDEAQSLFSLCNDLSKVLCKKIADEYLWLVVQILLEGLVDYQGHSSSGACVVLNNILKSRGPALKEKIPEIIDGLHAQLSFVDNNHTRMGTLRCMRTICHQFLDSAMKHLLDKPLPWDSNLVAMWEVLAGDQALSRVVFNHLMEVLELTLPYHEKTNTSAAGVITSKKVETPVPKSATKAISVLCQVEEGKEVTKDLFPKMFSVLIQRVGVSSHIEGDRKNELSPSSVAIDALKSFLTHTESEVMLKFLDQNNAWTLLEAEDTSPHGCLHLARAAAAEYPSFIQPIVEALSSSLSSIYDPQRITVVAFYSELLSTLDESNIKLAEQIMNNLLGRQVDQNYMVRMYCIRGLGNMADIKGNEVSKYSTTVLSAMLAGMDDREDPNELITMEAMNGLARIFDRIDEGHVRPILINISLRIRPCFEKPTPSVRAAAINLFGTLSQFGNGPSEGPFFEQIQTNFVSLLLHLNESDPTVVMACKSSLQKLGPLMKSQTVNDMFQKHLIPEESLLYPDFLNDLCKRIVSEFLDKVNFYLMSAVQFFKSMWAEVRSNAALFVGYTMGNLPKDKAGIVSKEHICEALILLLRDASSLVRSSAAEALSLLYEY